MKDYNRDTFLIILGRFRRNTFSAKGNEIPKHFYSESALLLGGEFREPVVGWLSGSITTLEECWCSSTNFIWCVGFGVGGGDDGSIASAGVNATWESHDATWIGDGFIGLGVWGDDLDCGGDAPLQVGEGMDVGLLTWGEEPVVVK